MERTVTLKAGDEALELSLPVCKIPGTDKNIIAFDSMGDMGLIHKVAHLLDKALPEFDIMVCPEAKAIPIGQALCEIRETDYYVLRKTEKLYMVEPKSIEVRSITTQKQQHLWYCAMAVKKLVGKKVLLFDDVISTGATLKVLNDFADENGLTVVSRACVFAEGDAKERDDITYLGYLPILSDSEL